MKKAAGISRANAMIAVTVILATAVAVFVVVRTDTTGRRGSGLGEEFVYDLPPRKIDPKLLKYTERTPAIETGLEHPSGIAVGPDGKLYVAGGQAVRVFDKSYRFEEQFPLAAPARCLAAADDGTIYVGMGDHVEVFDAQGKRKASWESAGKNAHLTSIAISGDNVFVADVGRLVVLRYDRSGKLLGRIGRKDADRGIDGLLAPSPYLDVAVGPNGLLWVANPGRLRLEAYTFGGNLEHMWGQASMTDIAGFTGCCNPVHFVILSDGRFVTSEKGGRPVVKLYGSQGVLDAVIAAPKLFKSSGGGLDLAADAEGRILVLDAVSKTVRIFTRKKDTR